MLKNEIEVGETYLFLGSDSPKRAHLAGQPFKVVKKERVYRKMPYRKNRKAGTWKVLRFFNEDGIGARAEELEPLPAEGFHYCKNCETWCRVEDLHTEPEVERIHNVCPSCGETAQVFDQAALDNYGNKGPCTGLDKVYPACEPVNPDDQPGGFWLDGEVEPSKDGFYNVITSQNRLIDAPYELGMWGIVGAFGEKVVRYRPSTYRPFKEYRNSITPEPGDDPDLETDGEKIGKALAGEDLRQWPCEDCEDGEMVMDGGTSPQGITGYTCNSCGKSTTFP